MRITLQCRGSGDPDWGTLNSDVYPIGPTWFDNDERHKVERRFDQLMQGWQRHFLDHQFRVVKPKGF